MNDTTTDHFPDNDAELLREFACTGSERAFAVLVGRHVDLVYSSALRQVRGNPHRAQEVTQMVFSDLAKKAASLGAHTSLSGWLYTGTRWAALKLLRTEQRRTDIEQRAAKDAALLSETNERRVDVDGTIVDWAHVAPVIDEALAELGKSDREAVLLRFFEGHSFDEVGARMGVGENGARMRVRRALGKLRELLARRGVTSSAAALGTVLTSHAVSAAPAGLAASVSGTALSVVVATGASGSAALFFSNFLMTKLQITVAVALVAALSFGIVHQYRANAATEIAIAEANRENRQFAETIAALEKRSSEQERALGTRAAVAMAKLTPEQRQRLQLDLIIRKGSVADNYGALFRQLRLPAEDLDILKTLIAERDQAHYDAIKVAKNSGVNVLLFADEQAIRKSASVEVDEYIAAVLGTEKYAQFLHYEEMKPYANSIGWFSDDSADRRPSMEQDEIMDMFVSLLKETCPTFIDDLRIENGWELGYPQEFIERVAPLLSEKTKTILDAEQNAQAARNKMNEIAVEAARAGKLNASLAKGSARDYAPASTTSLPAQK